VVNAIEISTHVTIAIYHVQNFAICVFRRPLCNVAHFTQFSLSKNLKLQTISTRTRTNSLTVYNEKFEKSDWPTAVRFYIVHGPMINDVYLRATA
jgi:hypothetical protein